MLPNLLLGVSLALQCSQSTKSLNIKENHPTAVKYSHSSGSGGIVQILVMLSQPLSLPEQLSCCVLFPSSQPPSLAGSYHFSAPSLQKIPSFEREKHIPLIQGWVLLISQSLYTDSMRVSINYHNTSGCFEGLKLYRSFETGPHEATQGDQNFLRSRMTLILLLPTLECWHYRFMPVTISITQCNDLTCQESTLVH